MLRIKLTSGNYSNRLRGNWLRSNCDAGIHLRPRSALPHVAYTKTFLCQSDYQPHTTLCVSSHYDKEGHWCNCSDLRTIHALDLNQCTRRNRPRPPEHIFARIRRMHSLHRTKLLWIVHQRIRNSAGMTLDLAQGCRCLSPCKYPLCRICTVVDGAACAILCFLWLFPSTAMGRYSAKEIINNDLCENI